MAFLNATTLEDDGLYDKLMPNMSRSSRNPPSSEM